MLGPSEQPQVVIYSQRKARATQKPLWLSLWQMLSFPTALRLTLSSCLLFTASRCSPREAVPSGAAPALPGFVPPPFIFTQGSNSPSALLSRTREQ